MTPEVRTRLLASMDAGRLVVVCGAGLSMAPPSSLPSAREISEHCFDRYRLTADPNCNPMLRSDLEALAEHFVGLGTLGPVFVLSLVPWVRFVRSPNPGHAAIADFLITRAAAAGLSSNYDTLIENCGIAFGFDFQSSLDGDEAGVHANNQGPLIKFHGCSNKNRPDTIWAQSQLEDEEIATRMENIRLWMTANLRQRDLLIVGFWSDWHYLNRIIGSALGDTDPVSIILVDPSTHNELQEKAPDLWALAHSPNVHFEHVAESATDVLDELRREFSINYLRQVFDSGRAAIQEDSGEQCDPTWLTVGDFDSETLYAWRRDAEGVSGSRAATKRRPENTEVTGFAHLLLRKAGAEQTAGGYLLNGQTIRVVNGAGQFVAGVAGRFVDAPTAPTADIVVAAGATDAGLPPNIVRDGRKGDIIRPRARGAWYDLVTARRELDI